MIKTTQMSQTEPELSFFPPGSHFDGLAGCSFICVFARRDRAYIACCADSGGACLKNRVWR